MPPFPDAVPRQRGWSVCTSFGHEMRHANHNLSRPNS